MAGDALSNGRKKSKLEQRLGTDEFKRIGAEGHQAPDDSGKWTAAEVISEFRNSGDAKVDEGENSIVNRFKDLQANGAKFNNRAQQYLSKKYGFEFGKKDPKPEEETPTPTPEPTPTPTPTPSPVGTTGGPGNTQGVTQDNDVTINGDGNQVNQDNSVTQTIDNSVNYGDDIRNFSYNGSKGEDAVYDTPVSMATMAGFYDVNDSPNATAQFLGKYIHSNNLAQKAMRADYDARTDKDYKTQAAQVNQFNPLAMQERIDREPLINRSRSTVDFAKLFGDVDNWQQEWTPTTAPSKIESEVGDIAEEYKDELD
jgi:hypothetical protein